MNIYSHLQIGTFHLNHCEDFLLTTEIGQGKYLLAIMDGCTMGTDSHFAATLTGKLLRKIAKEFAYLEFQQKSEKSLGDLLREVLRQSFAELRAIQNRIMLETAELLSTLLVAIVSPQGGRITLMCIGDGLVVADGEIYEFEQDNKPDYLGYHLHEEFDGWFSKQTQRLELEGISDLSLVSDGIHTFAPHIRGVFPEKTSSDALHYLLVDPTYVDKPNMLKRKMGEIEKEWGQKPTDDFAAIRMLF